MERRIAAILAADVVGYSTLMEADEVDTHARLELHLKLHIEPLIDKFRGRIVKLMGDGLLAEFASVVDAVTMAMAMQRDITEAEADRPESSQIRFRIGVHLGDIIGHQGDIYGDGVNIAARLEGLAEPGGIAISRQAFDQVGAKLAAHCRSIGPQRLKNIKRTIEVYRVTDETTGELSAPGDRGHRWRMPALVSALVILVAAAGLAVWQPWRQPSEAASIERMAYPLPEQPSIAVLPFVNMSADADQEYFVDGLTEDIITDLSKFPDLFVIARNSSFAYKGKTPPLHMVAEALGVRYILTGSARRIGEQFRVNAQLIDALDGAAVWAERVDRSAAEVFSIQVELSRDVATALGVQTNQSKNQETDKSQTDSIAAREAYQKGLQSFNLFNSKDNALAIEHLRQAVSLDPEYGRAYALLSMAYYNAAEQRWLSELGIVRREAARQGRIALTKATEFPSAMSHAASARYHLGNLSISAAHNDATVALAMEPNDPTINIIMADILIANGAASSAIVFVEKAMRLDPAYSSRYAATRGIANFALGDLQAAENDLRHAVNGEFGSPSYAPYLAATFAYQGNREAANEAIQYWLPDATDEERQELINTRIYPFIWFGDSDLMLRLHDGVHMAALDLNVDVDTLIARLGSVEATIRADAARALGWFGPKATKAVSALIDALGDEADVVRKESAIALGKIGPTAAEALPALQAIEKPTLVAKHAKEAIERIGQ